ncbi:hypothetical protein NMY22_g6349 [Coprinellus aureogranulatus]|nr:hypothetical protein NMY22_g6349 [Coprinellus aureogranulatus]
MNDTNGISTVSSAQMSHLAGPPSGSPERQGDASRRVGRPLRRSAQVLLAQHFASMDLRSPVISEDTENRSTHGSGILTSATDVNEGQQDQSPAIHRVPAELLQEMLLHSVDAYGPSAPPPSSSDTQNGVLVKGPCSRIKTRVGASTSPLLLAQVCSTWRETVLATPALWATLSVDHPQMQDLPLFMLWLERSGGYPINLDFRQLTRDLPLFPEEEVDEKAAAPVTAAIFFAEILVHSSRLRFLNLHLDSDMERPFIPLLAGVDQHSIEAFALDIAGWSTRGLEQMSQFLCKSPYLARGRWGQRMDFEQIVDYSQQLWSRLSTIHISIIWRRDALHLLPQMQSVKSLSIGILLFVDQHGTSEQAQKLPERVELGELTTLAFRWYRDLSPIFDSLILPSLTCVTLGSHFINKDDEHSENNQRSLQELLDRSGCTPRRILSDSNLPQLG